MKFFTLIFVGLFANILISSSARAADELPDLGDVSQTVLTPQQESQIANQIMQEVMASGDVVNDVEINDYVQGLGYKLVESGPDRRQNFNFFVVQDNTINAFAMPGGVVGVHTGLLVAANSESEVASVLGHEIGHVTQHHMARMMAAQKNDTFRSIAMLALAVLAARSDAQLGNAAMTAATASGIQKQLDYTRDHEREADRVGLQILDAAKFDTRAMPQFFETLQKGTRFVEGAAPAFLRTHPVTSERIADIKNRVEKMPYRQVIDSVEFYLVRAKLLAQIGTANQAAALFEGNIQDKKYTHEAAQHYGLAIAQLRQNKPELATKQVDWLRANMPRHPMVEVLAAKIAVARNDAPQAAKIYVAGLSSFPEYRGLIYGYAEHFLALGQTEKALKLVGEKQALYPDDPVFYELQARAYAKQGKTLLQHQAQGEAYFRRYDIQKAVEQFDLAAKAKDGDFYQLSIVEARLNQLKQIALNQKTES